MTDQVVDWLRNRKRRAKNVVTRIVLNRIVVRRTVQGSRLRMPLSHKLPQYARDFPAYGQNLVMLVKALSRHSPARVQVIDVGANIGDSAIQMIGAADVDVACIEGDPFWQRILRQNATADPRIQVLPYMLGTHNDGGESWTIERGLGTSRIIPGSHTLAPLNRLPIGHLSEALTATTPVRLIKSDTDGWDTQLVPALATAFEATKPLLFFEFDPRLAELVDSPTWSVWDDLAECGYDLCAVWDNFGNLLGRTTVRTLASFTSMDDIGRTDYDYWDVAAVHCEDAEGARALDDATAEDIAGRN